MQCGRDIGKLENVKVWRYIAVGILAVGAVYAYIYRQELGQKLGIFNSHTYTTLEDASTAQTTPSVRPAHIDWQVVDRSSDGFKVDMPRDIKDIQVPSYNESGAVEPVTMIYSNPDGETTFSVAWADNPPVARSSEKVPERILETARAGALARTQTTLVSESRSSPGGNPAHDFIGKNSGGGLLQSRLIYAGQRLYMLTAAFPSASARREQDVARFFNSFKVNSPTRIPESLPAASSK